MMPIIRIEDDIFEGLKSIAEPFTDTPNTVIRRLLEEKGVLKPKSESPRGNGEGGRDKDNRSGSRTASLTPQSTYEAYLLHVLTVTFNGRGEKHEVTKAVIDLMKSRGFIGPADLERVSTGETKAENTIAWGRNALKERGYLSGISPRGIWELTPEGIKHGKTIILPRKATAA